MLASKLNFSLRTRRISTQSSIHSLLLNAFLKRMVALKEMKQMLSLQGKLYWHRKQ